MFEYWLVFVVFVKFVTLIIQINLGKTLKWDHGAYNKIVFSMVRQQLTGDENAKNFAAGGCTCKWF